MRSDENALKRSNLHSISADRDTVVQMAKNGHECRIMELKVAELSAGATLWKNVVAIPAVRKPIAIIL